MTEVGFESPFYSGPVRWLRNPGNGELDGFAVVGWSELQAGWIARARGVGMRRRSLESAAQPWLDWLRDVDRLAVVDVVLDSQQAVIDLLGFVVEPATRLGIELVIGAHHDIDELDAERYVEWDFEHAFSLERLRWRLRGERPIAGRPAELPDTGFDPDPTQAAAVNAAEGVVEIIAPAGSGKPTVLIERVRELRRRGVPANAILCLTFNRAARIELQERLFEAGAGDVQAFTFHGFCLRVLNEAHRIRRSTKIDSVPLSQLRRLIAMAAAAAGPRGRWIEVAEAQRELSEIKLGGLMWPEEYALAVSESPDPFERTMLKFYEAYQEHLRVNDQLDFEDLILNAIRLLRINDGVRGYWQSRYQHVLVDEYQDIEPAQELLVRLVAAPHDQLFCVGDEDQTLYAFRRASVERIICLDGIYPGLQRIALGTNYRCPPQTVARSSQLIRCNQIRFPKSIRAAPSRTERGETISLRRADKQAETAMEVAKRLETRARGEIVVLARMTNALRPIALACADLDVRIDGHSKLFGAIGARGALQDHLRLVLHPEQASGRLAEGCAADPAGGLRYGSERTVAERLQAGASFADAFAEVPAPKRGRPDRPKLLAPGELFSSVAWLTTRRQRSGCCAYRAASTNGLRKTTASTAWTSSRARSTTRPSKTPSTARPPTSSPIATPSCEAGASRDGERDRLATILGAKGRQWPP